MSDPADTRVPPSPEPSSDVEPVADTLQPERTDRTGRLERLVKLSLALNALVLVLNGGLAYVLFAIVLAEPVMVAGVNDAKEHPDAGSEDNYPAELRQFFDRMENLLDREARKQGVNPADVIPTQAEIDNAVETRTIHSDESQLVMQKLREGFDYFDMTWPIAVPER